METRATTRPSKASRFLRRVCVVGAVLLCAFLHRAPVAALDAFADAVAAYTPGTNGGFNDGNLPEIVLGPPRGAGATQGSFDVLALGIGGSIVLRFDLPVICDGPGADFTIFENAFHSGSPTGPLFAEYGFVSVSQDGEHFIEFPYDAGSHAGLAGQTPVLSNPDNEVDPLDPVAGGGDTFDLATVGLPWAAYVKVTDVAGAIADPGDLPQFTVAPNAGFDLDAMAALHACDPNTVASPTPTATRPVGTPTPTATPVPSMPGDLDGNGRIDGADLVLLVAEIFDGDGHAVAAAGGGTTVSDARADVNRDNRVTAADLSAMAMLQESAQTR